MAYVVRATNTGSSAKQRKERSHHWKRRKGRRLEGDRRRQLPPLLGRHKVLLLVELAYTSTVSAVTAGNPAFFHAQVKKPKSQLVNAFYDAP
jgi:hypothetical protein